MPIHIKPPIEPMTITSKSCEICKVPILFKNRVQITGCPHHSLIPFIQEWRESNKQPFWPPKKTYWRKVFWVIITVVVLVFVILSVCNEL